MILVIISGLTFIFNSEKVKAATNTEKKIKVTTTFYPMYEFSKAILGKEGNVSLLIPSGSEPHDYEPSAKDIAKIADSDVFVYNSNQLEKWAKKMDHVIKTKTTVIEAAKGITLSKEESDSQGDSELDPHVWLDPVLAKKEVKTISNILDKKYPKKAKQLDRNRDVYLKKLDKLDLKFKNSFKKVRQRSFVTQHAAFGYLAKQYGIKQIAIAGLSPDQEPSPGRLGELKKYVKVHHLKVIYFEENATSKVAKTLADETGVKTSVLDPIEGISKNQLKKGASYISIMEHNLKNLKETVR
ncbi:metal ABC transporter solute-binding protein, Zn/Mn family [Enterococcus gilvus]|uniref:metal ABC transporter solute-binding protein, Zn/Mn family n=1 Tax=Enterococcus gilvus TaxID=160453 RepID=UPI003EDACF8F